MDSLKQLAFCLCDAVGCLSKNTLFLGSKWALKGTAVCSPGRAEGFCVFPQVTWFGFWGWVSEQAECWLLVQASGAFPWGTSSCPGRSAVEQLGNRGGKIIFQREQQKGAEVGGGKRGNVLVRVLPFVCGKRAVPSLCMGRKEVFSLGWPSWCRFSAGSCGHWAEPETWAAAAWSENGGR